MQKSIHSSAFLLSIVCVGLFLFATTSETFLNISKKHFHIHPLTIVLILTITCFFLNIIGMKEIKNLPSLVKSLISIILTLVLSIVISFILVVGNLFS